MNRKNDINIVIVHGISVFIIFALIVAVVIAAVFMFSTKGEFVSVLRGEIKLNLSFYIWTLVVIFVSSVLYTPFSFGISNYFINSKAGTGEFSQIFYLFKNPHLMLKAVSMSVITKIIINLYRIFILVVAVVAECGLFVISIIISGENIFDYEKDFLEYVMQFITGNEFFIILTVIEWCIVIVMLMTVKMRFILCKYALIRFPELHVIESVKIGCHSISGKIGKTFLFYIKYLSLYIVTFITFGLSGGIIKNRERESFSTYAVRIVERGRESYYGKY